MASKAVAAVFFLLSPGALALLLPVPRGSVPCPVPNFRKTVCARSPRWGGGDAGRGGRRTGAQVFSTQPEKDQDAAPAPPPPTPKTFADAETMGLELFADGDFEGALEMFRKSLDLPGTGWDLSRARPAGGTHPTGGAPNPGGGVVRREFPSMAEVQCAKYNMACCHAALGDQGKSLDLLDEVLASGFDDYDTMRRDTSLAKLGPELEKLIDKFQPKNPLERLARFFA